MPDALSRNRPPCWRGRLILCEVTAKFRSTVAHNPNHGLVHGISPRKVKQTRGFTPITIIIYPRKVHVVVEVTSVKSEVDSLRRTQ